MRLNLPAYSISLDKNRVQYISDLSQKTGIPITIFNASDGSEWWNSKMSRKHPWGNDSITKGMMGCTKSHLDLLNDTNKEGVYIFEDDAELVLPMNLVNSFIDDVITNTGNKWDIILLGANEYVSSKPITHEINRVYRFWGTHAMIINRHVYDLIKKTFDTAVKEDVFLPADWLYNETIQKYKLQVYGPNSPKLFFRQVPGLVSAITGRVRDA
jgi:GR25 family glycosyltransferase involved in LPS biosynthesis